MTRKRFSYQQMTLSHLWFCHFRVPTRFTKRLFYFKNRGNFLPPKDTINQHVCMGKEKKLVFLVCHKVVCNAKLPVIWTYKDKPDHCVWGKAIFDTLTSLSHSFNHIVFVEPTSLWGAVATKIALVSMLVAWLCLEHHGLFSCVSGENHLIQLQSLIPGWASTQREEKWC